MKWLTVGGRPDGEAMGGQVRVMDRGKRDLGDGHAQCTQRTRRDEKKCGNPVG